MASVQLRRYVLPLDHAEQDRWIEWWRGISAPRALYGFTIPFAVLDRGTGEFTWTVQHESDDFDTVEAIYMTSPERNAVMELDKPEITTARIAMVDVIV